MSKLNEVKALLARVSNDERGVSPVIGVILMVAITVILAAVIGTMVLGMTDSVGTNAQAGVSFDQTGSNSVDIQITSMGNADSLNLIFSETDTTTSAATTSGNFDSVGAITSVSGLEEGDKITVTATVGDSQNVVATWTMK